MKTFIFSICILFCLQANNLMAAKKNCSDKDWGKVGYSTAMAGKSIRSFDKITSKCNLKPEPEEKAKSLYLDGYTQAVIEFCTKQNGYNWGSENKKFPDVCPFEIRREFTVGYNLGRIDYRDKMAKFNKRKDDQEQGLQGNMNARRSELPTADF